LLVQLTSNDVRGTPCVDMYAAVRLVAEGRARPMLKPHGQHAIRQSQINMYEIALIGLYASWFSEGFWRPTTSTFDLLRWKWHTSTLLMSWWTFTPISATTFVEHFFLHFTWFLFRVNFQAVRDSAKTTETLFSANIVFLLFLLRWLGLHVKLNIETFCDILQHF